VTSPLNFIPREENAEEVFDPSSMIEKIKEGFDESAEEAYRERASIEIKMDFFRGYQHRQRGDDGRRDSFVQADDRIEFETIPLIRPTMRQAVALFTKNLPEFSLLPRGSGVRERYQARLAESFVNGLVTCYPAFFESLYYGKLLAEITGLAWLKTYWDAESDVTGALGGPQWDYVSRLDAFPNVRSVREKDIYRMYHKKMMPLERALEAHPTDWMGNPLDDSAFSMADARYNNYLDQSQEAWGYRGVNRGSSPVEIVECWIKPSRKFPLGGMIAFSGSTILALPYVGGEHGQPPSLSLPDGYWPWTKFLGLNKVPGRLAADGLAHDLIPMQMTINDYASNIKEASVNSSQNWLMASRMANVTADDMDNVSGTVIYYEQNHMPEWKQAPGPNQGIMGALDYIMQRYGDVSTQLDAARGVTNDSNAKLIAVQTELSTALHGPDLTIWANSELAGVAKQTLAAISANATEEHYLIMLGPNKKPAFSQFDPSVFHPNYQFVVIPGMDAPASREVKEAKILEAAAAQMFDDVPAARRARAMIPWMQGDEDTTDPKQAHLARVELEQLLFITQGVVPTLLDRDDHETHLEQDEPFSISAEFLEMAAANPELAQQYLDHMMGHQMELQKKQMIFAQQTATLSGGGSDKPGPEEEPPGAETPFSGGASPGLEETSGDTPPAAEIAQA
jgi:hypothetical protein